MALKPDDIIEFPRARLSGFETPMDVIFVDSLPHSNLDIKVDKPQLVDRFSDHYDNQP